MSVTRTKLAVLLGGLLLSASCSSSGQDSGTDSGGSGPEAGSTGVGGGEATGQGGSEPSAGSGGKASSGGASSASGPTFTELYDKYFATGTIGHCGNCHSFGRSASQLYGQFSSSGQIDGTSSPIAVQGSSILIWLGGSMPRDGSASDDSAVADLKAWVAAGALDN